MVSHLVDRMLPIVYGRVPVVSAQRAKFINWGRNVEGYHVVIYMFLLYDWWIFIMGLRDLLGFLRNREVPSGVEVSFYSGGVTGRILRFAIVNASRKVEESYNDFDVVVDSVRRAIDSREVRT